MLQSRDSMRNTTKPLFRARLEAIIAQDLKKCAAFGLNFDLWISNNSDDIFSVVGFFIDKELKLRNVSTGIIHS